MSIGSSCQVRHFFNAIRHHDGFRLVHPTKWDIGQFRGAFVTDADWCIPSGDSFNITFSSRFRRIPFGESRPYHHSLIIRFSNITFNFIIHFRIIFSKIYSIYVLNSYTHSCTHFIVTWFSTKILEIRIESENKPKLSNLASFSSISVLG